MAYPPVIPPNNRQNNTLELDNHPSDHNAIATALAALPWGNVAPPAILTTGSGNIGQTVSAVPGLSITATLVNGRRYRARAFLMATKPGASSSSYFRPRIQDGASTVGPINPVAIGVNGAAFAVVETYLVGNGASHVLAVYSVVDADSHNFATGSLFVVEDVGL